MYNNHASPSISLFARHNLQYKQPVSIYIFIHIRNSIYIYICIYISYCKLYYVGVSGQMRRVTKQPFNYVFTSICVYIITTYEFIGNKISLFVSLQRQRPCLGRVVFYLPLQCLLFRVVIFLCHIGRYIGFICIRDTVHWEAMAKPLSSTTYNVLFF